ncbi:MAG: hypothetical protein RLN63_04580 [Miltoncostaeaceae bacterium]
MTDHEPQRDAPADPGGTGRRPEDRIHRWAPVLSRPRRETLRRIEGRVRQEAHRRYGAGGHSGTVALQRRPLRLLVASGVVVCGLGGAAGAAMLFQSGDGSVPVDRGAERALRESSDLRRAPWLFQPAGSPHIATVPARRSLLFPRGTTYRQALTQLSRWVVARGRIPARTRPVAPLPRGVVWQPGTRTRGPRLSLVAPFGYTIPEGAVRTPSYRFRPGVDIRQAAAILRRLRGGGLIGAQRARGLGVDTPRLARCQINPPGRTPLRCRIEQPRKDPAPRT